MEPTTVVSVSMPLSLNQRLEAERERQGISNRSQFMRAVLEAYVNHAEVTA